MKDFTSTTSTPIENQTNNWIKLVPYGEWPHSRGMQRFTRETAETMVAHFKSLRQRLSRGFGGLPIFIGHPDDPSFTGKPGHSDTRAYAWIQDMETREDGLFIRPKWSEDGNQLLKNAFYKFLSPRWAMQQTENPRVYEPVRLLSVGLTNEPNIPGDSIANEQDPTQAPATLRSQIAQLLEIPSEDLSDEDILKMLSERIEENESLYKMNNHTDDRCQSLKEELDEAHKAFESEREQHIETLLKHAIEAGKLDAASIESWRARLHEDFNQNLEALDALSNTRALPQGNHTGELNINQAASTFRKHVSTAMHQGIDYASAWATTRRRFPDLYARMTH